jgi:sugar phosphate isomerase/epimerase
MGKVGIYSYFGYGLSFAERLDLIKGAGFEVTSFGLGKEEELVRQGEQDRMADLARVRGLFVEYVHAPEAACNNLWSEKDGSRREAVEEYLSSIGFCKKHGISTVVVHVTKSKGDGPGAANEWGLLAMREVAEFAEACGVRIAIENTQGTEHVDYVLSRVESASLGLCYDSSHDFLYSAEPCAILGRWGHVLMATHMSDNDAVMDRHWLPWEGVIPWERVRRGLDWTGYRGVLNLEIFPKDGASGPPGSFLKEALRRIRRLDGVLKGGAEGWGDEGNAREGI